MPARWRWGSRRYRRQRPDYGSNGTTLDVSGRGDQTLTLNSGQTLKGSGSVKGNLNALAGSTLSPGDTIGTLTVRSNVTLGGVLDGIEPDECAGQRRVGERGGNHHGRGNADGGQSGAGVATGGCSSCSISQ